MKKLFIIGLLLSSLANAQKQTYVCDSYNTVNMNLNTAETIGTKNAFVYVETKKSKTTFGFKMMLDDRTISNYSPPLKAANIQGGGKVLTATDEFDFFFIATYRKNNSVFFGVARPDKSSILLLTDCEKMS